MGKVIAICNPKGGVGKTTPCVNLGAAVAEMGSRALVIDLDAKGNATSGLGVRQTEIKGTVYHLLVGGYAARQFVLPTAVDNLFVLPSEIDMVGAEVELAPFKNREKRLKTAIIDIKGEFDYIFLDCPPSLGLITLNALVAADGVIVPMLGEFYSMQGLIQLTQTLKLVGERCGAGVSLDGVLFNMYDGRSLASKQIESEVKGHFEGKVFNTVIPKNIRIAEAPSFGLPVTLHDSLCVGARAYRALAKELSKGYK